MIDTILCAPLYAKSIGFIADGAVAIRQNTIVAVGQRHDLTAYASAHTRIIRYPDQSLLIPAFCDSHQHFLSYIFPKVFSLILYHFWQIKFFSLY